MPDRKGQVRRFYERLWNAHDKAAMPAILRENFTFRGSLGHQTRGHDEFAEYVDMVHAALDDYRCVIDDWVAEGDKVFAKLSFIGMHRGPFLGYDPTGMQISWKGCALFTFDRGRIADVWVLGDLKSLESQLQQHARRAPDARADSRCGYAPPPASSL